VITIFYHSRVGKTTTEVAFEFHSVVLEPTSEIPTSVLLTIHESDVIWHCERYGDYANNQSCPRTSGYKKKKRAESIDSARRLTICAPSRDYAAFAILRSDLKPARTSSEKSCGCSHAAKCPPLSSLL